MSDHPRRKKLPPKVSCRECGADMGRSWREAPICNDCGQLSFADEVKVTQLKELPGTTWEDIFR